MGTPVKPYKESKKSKTRQVEEMFDNISSGYDTANKMMSLGLDYFWRRTLVRLAAKFEPKKILDIATGTADLAIDLVKAHPEQIVGVDISEKMLEIGLKKIKEEKLDRIIRLQTANCENLPFAHNTFDMVTIAFGARNFENLPQALAEIRRVLRPGGALLILELSEPQDNIMKQLYKAYTGVVIPLVGRITTKDPEAFTYLPRSIEAFPAGNKLLEILREDGFISTRFYPLTMGLTTLYKAIRP